MSELEKLKGEVKELEKNGDYGGARELIVASLRSVAYLSADYPQIINLLTNNKLRSTETAICNINILQLKVIGELVNSFIEAGDFDLALNIVNGPFPNLPNDGLTELKVRIYHRQNHPYDEGLLATLNPNKYIFDETVLCMCGILFRKKKYRLALEILRAASQKIQDDEILRKKFDLLIEQIQNEFENEEKIAYEMGQSLIAEEEKGGPSKPEVSSKSTENKGKEGQGPVKKAVEVELKSRRVEESPSTQPEVAKEESQLEAGQSREFEVSFTVQKEQTFTDHSFKGMTKTNTFSLQKSFVKAQDTQINNIVHLVNLCSTHQSLLSVEQGLKVMNDSVFLITESVEPIGDFFMRKFEHCSPESDEEWWKIIQAEYWIIFRDIIRALMYLFSQGEACGELSFNSFVTEDGRGRILPSFNSPKDKDDLHEVNKLMKSVIKLAEGESEGLDFLPKGLKNFFHHLDQTNTLLSKMRSVSLIDHPYFWSVSEKVDFSFKMRKLFRKKRSLMSDFNLVLDDLDLYNSWEMVLDGVYRQVWLKPVSSSSNVKRYTCKADIIRYFHAVYNHVNEFEYDRYRTKELSDEEIETDLVNYYPNYYTNMFTCLCRCAVKGYLTDKDLMDVSTVYHRDIEHEKLCYSDSSCYFV